MLVDLQDLGLVAASVVRSAASSRLEREINGPCRAGVGDGDFLPAIDGFQDSFCVRAEVLCGGLHGVPKK
jgi:hypothetical protein